MPRSNWFRLTLFGLVLPFTLLAAFLLLTVNAASLQAAETEAAPDLSTGETDLSVLHDGWQSSDSSRLFVAPQAAADVITPTTLTVTILSTPWAVLDSNKPAGSPTDPTPNVFMVEAVVTNTGDYDAVGLAVELDYDEDDHWQLLANEDPLRTPEDNLAPGEAFYAYWFATYPVTFSQSHLYTVTAWATMVDPVSTSTNFFETPAPGATVATDSFLSTGNSGVTQVSANIIVGVIYTITVDYDLGTNPQSLILSPVGNRGFDAGTSRVLASSVRLYNGDGTHQTTIADRLYVPTIPNLGDGNPPEFAEVTYTLLPLTRSSTEICSFAAVGYSSQQKYDQFYCDPGRGTSIVIEGTLSYTMSKQVNLDLVQQEEILSYTINYTNDGTIPLQHAWVWDEVDPAVASIITETIDPQPVASATDAHRVVWFLGTLPATGAPGSTGTLTFQAKIDGGGQDLADGTQAINRAFFGISPGSPPVLPALTATVTSTVQAPAITLVKSDGLETVGNGQTLTYTLTAANSGSVAATNLVLTDVLPAEVSLVGMPSPAPDEIQGQTLIWTSLADLGAGDKVTVTIPAAVGVDTPSFVDLFNQASLGYGNEVGYTYDVETASDTTTVERLAGFVEGYAFVDSAGDGTFDGGETRLSGVQITLPSALTPTVTTDANGKYRFRVEVEEPISVTAELPADHFRTTPETVLLDNTFGVTQTVNFGYAPLASEFGVVFGTVFGDNNHDGDQDGGESGLPGVVISGTNAYTNPVFSGVHGQFTLRFETSGGVTIEETNPAGYVSTTPDAVQVAVVTGGDQSSPVDFGDFLGVKVQGKVFDDLDADGQDSGEPGLAGALVSLSSGESAVTGQYGSYTLYGPAGATITITEQNPAGYVSTGAIPGSGANYHDDDNLVITTAAAGVVYGGNLFGDVLPADLGISKGAEPEPVAAGEVITYTLSYQNLGPAEAMTVTITDTLPGDMTFMQVIDEKPAADAFEQSGQVLTWRLNSLGAGEDGTIVFTAQVSPDAIGAVSNAVEIGSDTADLARDNNSDRTESTIGSPDLATIYGYVFEDLNANGKFDAGEIGIDNVEVWLDDITSTTTNGDGQYYFITDEEGVHKVEEVDPAGYISTTSNKRVVSILLGTSERVDFGDAPDDIKAAVIYGTVFNDANSSGTWDGDETGLSEVTITLDGAQTLKTDVQGGYTFSVTVHGIHGVEETDPPNYFSTTSNAVEIEGVELGHSYEVNFGDVLAETSKCDPDEYENDDVAADAAGLPLNDWQRHDFCDDAVDWTVFSARLGSVYTITTSSFDQRVDTYIALYDSDGKTLLAANDDMEGSSDFSSQLSWWGTGNDDYFVKTVNMGAVTGRHTDYDIQVTEDRLHYQFLPFIPLMPQGRTVGLEKPLRQAGEAADVNLADGEGPDGPLGVITHTCPDAYEIDDSWQTAAAVDHGDVQVHSFDSDPVLYAADKDYLGFSLMPYQTITFTVTSVTNTTTLLEAFDGAGQSLGMIGTDQLVLPAMPSGQYTVRVSPQSAGAFGCADEVGYEIAVEKPPRYALYLSYIANDG